MANYTMIEQETNINYNRFDDYAVVYTASPHVKKKLEKLLKSYPSEVSCVNSTTDDIIVKLPKEWIKIKPPRQLSESQLQHLKNMRKMSKDK